MTMDATRPAQDPPKIEHPRIPARVAPRRRPSGEAPPLPHHLGRTGKFWLIMVAYFEPMCFFVKKRLRAVTISVSGMPAIRCEYTMP